MQLCCHNRHVMSVKSLRAYLPIGGMGGTMQRFSTVRQAAALALALSGVAAGALEGQSAAKTVNNFDSQGVPIWYDDTGSGPAVILIHGFTGTVNRHWRAAGTIAELGKSFRVIAPDLRGHGRSGKPHDPGAYGGEMAKDVIRLMDHLGVKRAHIVGYSLGAAIAGKLLVTNPERFITATFVASAPWSTWTAQDSADAEAAAKELEGDMPFRGLIVRLTPPEQPPPTEAEIRAMSQAIVARNDVRALAAFQHGRKDLVVTDPQLRAIRVPTLGIVGGADRNADAMKALKSVIKDFRLVVVDSAAHGGDRGIIRSEAFLASLREMLSQPRR
jgi:pimeloyl-ACP methyl ester carboxylesterase